MRTRADGGLPGLPPRAVGMTPLRSVEDPRMPFRVLTAILLVGSVVAVTVSHVPGPDESLHEFDLVAGIVLAVTAALLWFLGDRLPNGWGLDLAVIMGAIVATFAALHLITSEGQVILGIGYVLFGVFLGYFRPPPTCAVLLAVMLTGYMVAVTVNRHMDTLLYYVLICLLVVGVTVMVSRLVTQLRALALRDSLTGTLNRRGLDLVAEPLAAAAARSGQPVTVGLLDIDSFKAYNDTHGHQAGDAALVAVVDAWRTQLRSSDILARYGGDEFALVLPGTRREDAEELAARLATAHELRWTAGFVEWTPQEDLYAALGRADTLMLDRKPKRG